MTHTLQPQDLVSTADPPALKPPVDPVLLQHKELRDDEFWRRIPAYRNLGPEKFHDHRFQVRNCITSLRKLREVVGQLVPGAFYEDVAQGLRRSTMSMRISPYIASLIDWDEPYGDPLRIQFVPVGSRLLPDHPKLTLDSLHEQADSPAPGLTHRYFDRALFLALDTCPVYCRFCTRSYAVGLDTEDVEKLHLAVNTRRWEEAFAYIASRPELEDIVISGGDVYNLKAEHIEHIGFTLLELDHIRRLRFASKGPAVVPQKLVSDQEWVNALNRVVEAGRRNHKEVVLHTHFNHPREITGITRQGLNRLMELGITVRNQAVLQRGVNDDVATMHLLVRRLSYVNVHPYYVFVHDMVKGVEDLRTTLEAALVLEKQVRGLTAGFNTPAFVLDTLGGGGKRNVHSYECYQRDTGIAVFTSPVVRPGQFFFYFDPIHTLPAETRERWQDEAERAEMLRAALEAAPKGAWKPSRRLDPEYSNATT
jgi:lysine 2,3-aminomutase